MTKLTHLNVQNWWRVKEFVGDIAPFTIVAGGNGTGKTSLRKAVEFLYTGHHDAGRGKDGHALLLHDGATAGTVSGISDGARIVRDIATGKALGAPIECPQALPYVLRADEFAKPETDRRTLLFNVMGLSTGPDEIQRRLLEKGVDPERINAIRHLLPGGFAPALAEAEKFRQQAKGAWCEVTGARQYGKNIAAEWQVFPPGFKQQEYDDIQADLKEWAKIIAKQNQLVGELNAFKKSQAALPSLREQGKTFAAEQETLNRLRAEYDALKAELEALDNPPAQPAPQTALPGLAAAPAAPARRGAKQREVAAAGAAPLVTYDCPCCTPPRKLIAKGGKILLAPEEPAAAAETPAEAPVAPRQDTLEAQAAADAARERRAQIIDAMGEKSRQVVLQDKKVTEANGAIALADQVEKQALRPELEKAPAALADAEEGLKECQAADAAIRKDKEATEKALEVTARAQKLHADVQAWEVMVAALGPDGVPKDILSAALGPLDEQLAASAEATGWPKVTVDADMKVSAGGFPYHMLSESFQWRADVQLAVAIARISGLNFVLADRMDVLDLPSRGEFLNWAYGLCMDEGLQVIAFGTLKAPPKLPEGTAVYWLGEQP